MRAVNAPSPVARERLIWEIFWTRTGLLLLALLLLSGGLLVLASVVVTDGVGRAVVLAVGTGTLTSAIITFGQTIITAESTRQALVTPLVAETRSALRDLTAEYRALNQEFYPTHVFEPTTEPDPAFNHLLMRDLHHARQYFFRGFSGWHAAVRLLLSHAEWELRVVIADPRQPTAVGGRARYLLRRSAPLGDYEAVCDRLHEEIRVGLVGLYLARSRCSSVELTVVPEPALDRLEIFDDSIWLSLFSDTSGATALYPRTLRFTEKSYLYAMERAEVLELCNSHSARHFVIRPDIERDEFRELFGEITGTSVTEAQLFELEAKFQEFQQEFVTTAELRS